jgi:hypothetical protein
MVTYCVRSLGGRHIAELSFEINQIMWGDLTVGRT